MSQQGEFKRKLLEALGEKFYTDPSVNWAAHDAVMYWDEAKKEFPKKRDIKHSDFEAREPVDKATFGELVQGLEAIEWYKKWFGEA